MREEKVLVLVPWSMSTMFFVRGLCVMDHGGGRVGVASIRELSLSPHHLGRHSAGLGEKDDEVCLSNGPKWEKRGLVGSQTSNQASRVQHRHPSNYGHGLWASFDLIPPLLFPLLLEAFDSRALIPITYSSSYWTKATSNPFLV